MLADHIHVMLPGLQTETNPVKMYCERNSGGRRRHLDDSLFFQMELNVKQRKVSGGQLQAPTIGVASSTVNDRHTKDLVAQLAVGKRVMASGKSFSIASDGVKIGKPKKETVAYLAVNHDKGRAQWLAPQEPGPAGLRPLSHP